MDTCQVKPDQVDSELQKGNSFTTKSVRIGHQNSQISPACSVTTCPRLESSSSGMRAPSFPRVAYHAVGDRSHIRWSKWSPLIAGLCICVGILFCVGVYLLTQNVGALSDGDCSNPSISLCANDYYYMSCQSTCSRFITKETHVYDLPPTIPNYPVVNSPITVGVYYEADCPDSATFFSAQMEPLINKLPDNFTTFLQFKFYPFGKAHITRNGVDCQVICSTTHFCIFTSILFSMGHMNVREI